MPLRASMLPNGPNLLLYRHLQFGNLIDMTVLDTRQYRSKQAACGDPVACPELLDVRRTILGESQERWLFDTLASAKAKWTVIGQQVPTFARDMASVNAANRFSVDKWDGYTESRNRLFAHLRDSKAPNPIVLSGDVHTHWCADLKTDFTNPKSPTVGVEFTNSSVTSGGDGSDVQPTWETMRRDNPHITYHSNKRGYISCTATPDAMKADFRIVDRVTVPNQPARTARTMVVEAGRAGSTPS
jgi:alkaline phosphatase D